MLNQNEMHTWADTDYDLSWTMAVIGGRTQRDVVTTYGGNPDAPIGTLTFEEAWVPEEDFGTYFHLQTLTYQNCIVAIENNGWAGQSATLAQRISENGASFISVYWSPSGLRIVQATDGKTIADFDPLSVGYPAGHGDTTPEWIESTSFTTDAVRSEMLLSVEKQTGIAFDRAWFDLSLPTYRIPSE